jgi:uncharacterized membrane protein YedE/YeeE
MNIDFAHFTPGSALAGGVLIGVAAGAFMLFNGRIAGLSGMVARLLDRQTQERGVSLAFIAGLAAAPWAYRAFFALPEIHIGASSGTLVAAGLLVGLGTRYGSGCTSGHGVCGLSRGSLRSFVATAVFMSFGFLTVYLIRHS